MAALLIRRRRPIGEPSSIRGTAGAGRIALALSGLGFALDDATQLAIDADLDAVAVDAVDLGIRFDLVALGSHLVNLPDAGTRGAFLRLAARHAAPGAPVLVEHHPLDWAITADATPATPGGAQPGMVDVRRDPPFVSAVSVYDVGGRVVRQPFTARVLSDAELDGALDAAGLTRTARLAPTWLAATPAMARLKARRRLPPT
jgi:hypothetical protein